jgi:hypothetical protein
MASFTLRVPDPGVAEVRLSFGEGRHRRAFAWGEGWPLHGARVPVEALLGALAEAWPGISAGYRSDGGGSGRVTVLEAAGLPRVTFGPGRRGRAVSSGTATLDPGKEYVLVVELLMALGDALSETAPGSAAASAWRRERAATDLPPMDVEGEGPLARDRLAEQAAWYARKLGIDPADYAAAALDVHARQVLHGIGQGPEPARDEWSPRNVPADLDRAAAAALASRAVAGILAAGHHADTEGFAAEATMLRNIEARQLIIYAPAGATDQAENPRP